MSTVSFPSLPLQTWPIIRSAIWRSNIPESISGKVYPLSYYSMPKWRWELTYSGLRAFTTAQQAAEIQLLQGFFDSRSGRADSFLYSDTDDRSSSGSTIGTGDSTKVAFQLQRSLGGFNENILAPTTVTSVYVGGTAISSTGWSVSLWGTSSPGIVTFSTANIPANGQSVTADFIYSWPVIFDQDILSYEEFVRKVWALKVVSFTSVR